MEFPNFAETQQNSRNACVSALKSCPDYPILLILGPLAPETPEIVEFPKFGGTPGNLVKIAEFCGISPFLRKNAIRAEMTKNTYKKALVIQPF